MYQRPIGSQGVKGSVYRVPGGPRGPGVSLRGPRVRGRLSGFKGVKGLALSVPGGQGVGLQDPRGQGVGFQGHGGQGIGLQGLRGSRGRPTGSQVVKG